jgi:hypothetical protein
MPAHHSVGSSIREMTPNFSILVNSALTLSISGNGTLRGTDKCLNHRINLVFRIFML